MFDVLSTLSKLVQSEEASKKETEKTKPKKQSKKPTKAQKKPAAPPQSTAVDTRAVAQAEAKVKLAEAQARELIIEAKDKALKLRREAESEARGKQEAIDRREGALEQREKHIADLEKRSQEAHDDAQALRKEHIEKLEKLSNLTREQAKEEILTQLEQTLHEQMAARIRDAEDRAHEEAEAKTREIVVDAIRHGATDYVPEYTVSIVKIKDEDMKGRIIGQQGRNIRAFETATGVDVDLDEEGVIRLSCFDSVRREVARVALEKLMRDGRIQPGRIEDTVKQVKKDLDRVMFEEGKKLAQAVGVYNLPAPLIQMLGKFKYRFSYGQNMITHTLEETQIGVAIAKEVGADANIVRLGCLLHDIGKVVPDKEGSHVELGVELLKKYKIPSKVIDTVAQHHEDTPFTSLESMIVYIADAISGSRPGARYENHEEYVKRLTDLEDIANSHTGVKEAYAVQAGRDLRIAVDPGKVSDDEAVVMAQNIKKEVQEKKTYPGNVKIHVVRELRTTEVAK